MARPQRGLGDTIRFRVSPADAEALKREAEFDGLTSSDLARAALKLFLEKRKETADARLAIRMGWPLSSEADQ